MFQPVSPTPFSEPRGAAMQAARLSYTVAQAVNVSGIGRTTLYSFMKSGELPHVKLGNRTLIRHVDLEHLLERHVSGQPSAAS